MSTIVTRVAKGTALTWTEMDDNFINLNTDKYQSGSNPTFGAITTTSITAGTYNGLPNAAASSVTYAPAGTIAATNVQDAIEELDSETQAALAGIIDPTGTTGIGTYLVSGATIAWESGLIYRVGAASYFVDGVAVTSAEQTVTLTAAPPTDNRIDVLVLNATGTLSAVAGTPAADPAEPSIDPSVYLRLGLIYVQAGSTAPSITVTDIYLNNAEWTATPSAGTIDVNSTSNPRSGSKCIEGTSVAANTYVSLVKPAAGTVDLATQNSLIFYVRLKAAFPSTKAIRLGWYSGASLRGLQVTISNGLFGFNSSTTGSYQQIVVPISAFSIPQGNLVTTLRATIVGSGANVGFYLDDIVLHSGATVIPSLTASRALVSNVSGNVAASLTTAAEIGYVSGVTSSIQTQLNTKSSKVIQVACSDQTTALTTGTAKVTFRMPYALTLTSVRASLSTAQASGSIFTVDINDSGTTVLSTKLTIDNTEKTSTTAATPPVISDSALADDAEITVDIDQIGNGTAKGLVITLIGT